MNARQRFRAALTFEAVDRIPLQPGGGRKSTRENWHRQGLPEDVEDIPQFAYRQAGGELDWPTGGPGFKINERLIPEFEEKVIEDLGETQIVQDWKGNVCEISKDFNTDYLRNAIDFVTRRWVKCPVESRADWQDMKRRYDPTTPERLPADPVAAGAALRERDWPLSKNFPGPFWQLREWLGFEQLCMLFVDDPGFVEEMVEFWTEFIAELLTRAFAHHVPDEIHVSEDMAYKAYPMISPSMTRRFLLPAYQRWGQIVRDAGIPIYALDSDGFVGSLIPVWIDGGFNVCDPIEVAAHNDIVEFRQRFGHDIAFRGGVDKRAIAKGGAVIDAELARLRPVIEDGGYIPSCDHGVPPDISWPNFVYYTGELAKLTGWL